MSKASSAHLADHRWHDPWPLLPADRATLPGLTWNVTSPQHASLHSQGALGSWTIGAPRKEGRFHEPVKLSYASPFKEGVCCIDAIEKYGSSQAARAKCVNQIQGFPQELGYMYDQDYARRFIEQSRYQSGEGDIPGLLLEAGFKESANKNIFNLPDAYRGHFTLFLRPTGVSLSHEKA